MSGYLCLTGLSQERVAFMAWRFSLSFLSQSFDFLGKSVGEGERVLEPVALHGTSPRGRERDRSLCHR